MGIEDIQISEELETNVPSIKYSGNEGPKSPQEMEKMIMASLEEEYAKYVFEMQEQGIEPMSLEQFLDQAMAEGQMSGGNPLPQDPTKPVNPFAPKPTGPTLPKDPKMIAKLESLSEEEKTQLESQSRLWRNLFSMLTETEEEIKEFLDLCGSKE